MRSARWGFFFGKKELSQRASQRERARASVGVLGEYMIAHEIFQSGNQYNEILRKRDFPHHPSFTHCKFTHTQWFWWRLSYIYALYKYCLGYITNGIYIYARNDSGNAHARFVWMWNTAANVEYGLELFRAAHSRTQRTTFYWEHIDEGHRVARSRNIRVRYMKEIRACVVMEILGGMCDSKCWGRPFNIARKLLVLE